MPFQPFNYGNVIAQGENILNSRAQRDPNSPQNQLLQAKIAQSRGGGIDPTSNMRDIQFLRKMKELGYPDEEIRLMEDAISKRWYGDVAGVPGWSQGGNFTGMSNIEDEGAAIAYQKYMEDQGKLQSQAGISLTPPQPTFDQGLGGYQGRSADPQPAPVSTPQTAPVSAANVAAEKTTAQEQAKVDVEKKTQAPKRQQQMQAQADKSDFLKKKITKAKSMANMWTVGFLGDQLKGVAGSPAHDLQETLGTIKANIGFDKLQEMRDSSPTGGALGQVSEQENKLLQAVWGALEQSQSKKQFIENLTAVEKQIEASNRRIAAAYEADYGVPWDGESIAPGGAGAPDDDPLGLFK